jgi:NAD(P)-dependent dehydrogenase (short-subunit alcohol dehydrogenase family)
MNVDSSPPARGVPGARWYEADVSDSDALEGALGSIGNPSRIAFVHAAAVATYETMKAETSESLRRVIAVNLTAFLDAGRILCPSFVRGTRGSIVAIGSVHATATSAGMVAYSAAKGGLRAAVRAMALELAPLGTRVNIVSPGATDTPMLRAGLSRGHLKRTSTGDRMSELAARIPLGRVAKPEDVAAAVEFLLDENRAGLITGAELVVDGGVLASLSSE